VDRSTCGALVETTQLTRERPTRKSPPYCSGPGHSAYGSELARASPCETGAPHLAHDDRFCGCLAGGEVLLEPRSGHEQQLEGVLRARYVVQRLGARRLNQTGTRDIEERRARGMDRASQAQTSVAVRPKGISMFVASVLDPRDARSQGIATPRNCDAPGRRNPRHKVRLS